MEVINACIHGTLHVIPFCVLPHSSSYYLNAIRDSYIVLLFRYYLPGNVEIKVFIVRENHAHLLASIGIDNLRYAVRVLFGARGP